MVRFASSLFILSASLRIDAFGPSHISRFGISSNSRLHASSTEPLFVDMTSNKNKESKNTHSSVSTYYSQTLQSSSDLQTNACCTSAPPPPHIQSALSRIHPDVISKYYGCGLCLPNDNVLDGLTILDLGCGSGRDVYIASQLVGKNGRVVGVDMTREQLDVAERTRGFHEEEFGYGNVEFVWSKIEELDAVESLEDGSVDVIISNCVINLCPDKEAVLKSCHRLLKDGGEMYFSDVYSNRRVPQTLRDDEVLWGECLSGALYWNDFQNLAKKCGFKDPRLVEDAPITVKNKKVEDLIHQSPNGHGLEFYSATYRLWKIDSLEPMCEDYGQAVVYKGTMPMNPSVFKLDNHHIIETGKVFRVCGNTFDMLNKTRLRDHFDFIGDQSVHYGIYEGCGTTMPFTGQGKGVAADQSSSSGSCC